MTTALTVLIVGGYGIFGGRIVALLENEPRLTLVVAGRSAAKARAFVRSRTQARARLVALAFDRNGDIGVQLAAMRPAVLVDASGPFQAYGDDRYRIVDACLAYGVNYLDLADGSDFVAGIGAFDDRAKAAGLYVLSGVSSFPVLTAAAVRQLSCGMTVEAIRGGIAPSPYANVGENVIRAIAAYAGQPVRRKRDGGFSVGYPFTEQYRYTIATPGRVPLERRMFSLVDVPDLRALAQLWPDAQTVWMGAAPVPQALHRALTGFAWLVRWRVLATLSPLAPLMHVMTNRVRWGEHRGGMFVEVEGKDAAGRGIRRSWHLIAEGDDGPLIPSMAVEAIVRKMLQERGPAPGARAAVADLELDDYEVLFVGKKIFTGFRDDGSDATQPLYARLLGPAFAALPAEIRDMHDVRGVTVARGRANVERGRNPLARLVAALVGFPKTFPEVAVRVEFAAAGGEERWLRTFGGASFASRQFAGHGAAERLLCERFGPFTFGVALMPDGERLSLVIRRWSAFGVPLPLWLAPWSHSYESVERGRFKFHVDIGHRLTGRIIRYEGWLVPDREADPVARAQAIAHP